jgi:membrane protease YdiL (CAAX protease family)
MNFEIVKIVLKEIGYLIVALLLSIAISFIFNFILNGNGSFLPQADSPEYAELYPIYFIGAVIAQQISFAICAVWRKKNELEKIREWKRKSGRISFFRKIGFGVLASLGLLVLVKVQELFLTFFFDERVLAESIWDQTKSFAFPEKIAILFIGAFIAPIIEELYFREVMLGSIVRSGFPSFAMFFSCATFAIIHLDPLHIFAYLIFGIGISLLYLRTKSIIPSITAHILINTILLTLFFFW